MRTYILKRLLLGPGAWLARGGLAGACPACRSERACAEDSTVVVRVDEENARPRRDSGYR